MVPATPAIYTSCHPLSLHDALPICATCARAGARDHGCGVAATWVLVMSEAISHFHFLRPLWLLALLLLPLLLWRGLRQAATERELARWIRSEEHTSELQSLMRSSYAVFCLKKKKHLIKAQDY